jgi:hypothetical protein
LHTLTDARRHDHQFGGLPWSYVMGLSVRIVSHPDPDYPKAMHDHLWVLVGGENYSDGATAYYLGPNRDIEGDDLAIHQIPEVLQRAQAAGFNIDGGALADALRSYRSARGG